MQPRRITSIAPQPLAFSIALALLPAPLVQAQGTSTAAGAGSTTLELNTLLIESDQLEQTPESAVSTLTRDQIDRSLSTDLEQLLRYEPGVNVSKDSRFGIGSINVRGLDGDRVKLLIDGVEQADAYGPTTTYLRAGRSTLDIDALEAVEIVKGGDIRSGSGALGGVVKYRTREPASFLNASGNDSYLALKGGYRSASDQFSKTLTLANRYGDLESLLVYTRRDGQETENYGGSNELGVTRGAADPGDLSSDNLLAKLNYQLNDNNRIGLVAERFNSDSAFDLLSESSATSTRRSDDENERTRLGISHDSSDSSLFADTLHWQLDYQKTQTRNGTQVDSSSSTRYVDRSYDEKSLQAQIELQKTLGNHQLRYGLDYTAETLENLNRDTLYGTSRFSPKADGRSVGVYLQDNWSLTPRLTLIPALRYDHYHYSTEGDAYIDAWGDNTNRALTAQLGAEFALNERYTLFGKYGSGFRAPDMDDLYYYYENNVSFGGNSYGYLIAPNPDLKPERSIFLEAGLRSQGEYGSAELVGFYNHYRDFIEQVSLGSSATYTLGQYTNVNLDDVVIKGVELKGQLALDRLSTAIAPGWRLNAALAWAEGENREQNQPLDSIAPLTLVTGLGYDHPSQRWGGRLDLTWVDGKDTSDISSGSEWLATPSHTLLDLTGYYAPTDNIKIAAGLFNLTDEKYWVWNDIRNLSNTSTNLDRYTQPGRNVGVDLTVSF